MISKKDIIVLGLVAAGGYGIVKLRSSGKKEGVAVTGGSDIKFKPFAGIVGSNKAVTDTGDNAGTTSIILPPEPTVNFPSQPSFVMPEFSFSPEAEADVLNDAKIGGATKTTRTKKEYATGIQKAVIPTGETPKTQMEAAGFMSGLGLSLAGVTPKVISSGGSSSGGSSKKSSSTTTASTSTSSTKTAAPKSKKKPTSFSFKARSLGGGWSTGY